MASVDLRGVGPVLARRTRRPDRTERPRAVGYAGRGERLRHLRLGRRISGGANAPRRAPLRLALRGFTVVAPLRHFGSIVACKLSIPRAHPGGTTRAYTRGMRSTAVAVAVAVAAAIGCGAPFRSPELPATEPTALIDKETFATKISGLRATLARSSITLDETSVIRTCEGQHSSDCVRCDVASRADTSGVDPEMIDGVAIAFARYPSKILVATKLEHVALCRRLRYEDKDKDSDHSTAGLADVGAHRMLISIEHFVGKPHDIYAYFTIEQVVHHELFHVFDHATLGTAAMQDDHVWHKLNPRGFEYRPPAPESQRPAGFVNPYATTNEMEDRASVYEYLMGQPAKLCEIAEGDPVVARKATEVWRRLAAVAGDAFMLRQAPCLRQKPKPKPVEKPKAPPVKRTPGDLWSPRRIQQ